MHPFITLSVAVLSGHVSLASLFGPFLASGIAWVIIYLVGLCQRSRTMADVYLVPMIMYMHPLPPPPPPCLSFAHTRSDWRV
jgi:hypothetical protein